MEPKAGWVRPVSALTWPRMPPAVAHALPAVVLILASITYAEFLTGSTPVLTALVDPVSLAFLLGLYGAGVLLVREAAVRWSKGWPTVLLLGAAYGIAEEGIGTKTFFGPKGVGVLAVYGHWAGVNWVWAVELSLFHAIFSIALPIATVGLVFPSTQGRSFLPTSRSLGAAVAAFAATVAAMFVLFNPSETPAAAWVVGALAAMGLLVLVARRAPASLSGVRVPVRPGRAGSPIGMGVAFTVGFFAISWIGPALVPVPVVVIGAILAWVLAFGAWVVSRQTLLAVPGARADFVLGALGFLFVFGAVEGAFGDVAVFPVMAVVLVGFLRLRRALRAPAPVPPPGASLGASALP